VGFLVVKMVMGQVFSEYILQFPVAIFIPTIASLNDELKKRMIGWLRGNNLSKLFHK
jgi:hypothetical protein